MNEERELDLEGAIKEVERIIKELERKDLPLDEALKLFEQGLELINLCEDKLKQARLKVEVILKKGEKFELADLDLAKELFKNEGERP
jgi:exodeoxyribonuclease VII small subunit